MPPDTTHSGGPGNTGRDWAAEYNAIQQFALDHSRLRIPVIFGVAAVHGFGHPFQAPLFPQSIGMGATWAPAAAQAGGAVTAAALRATGWNWNFAPVQDLARDNRWGRYYETWAEQPTLAAAMGAANVRGMQASGPAGSLGVTATVKHFAGYSEAINGHDRVEAQLSLRYLQDQILPSYAGGVSAGAGTVMVNSGSVNGVPATGSRFLLTEELRNRLGFKGGALPLAAGSRLVVTGPSADSVTNQLGGWSVSWQGVFGAGHVCCMGPANQIPPATTVLGGLRAADPNVVSAPDQASAVAAAASADAVVVAVGERAYAEGLGDDPSPQLAADPKALSAALVATGKPVIVVVIAGRPVGLGQVAEQNASLLMMYQGSTEAGTAVADAIFGKIDPSGHLSVTWPSDSATVGGDFNGGAASPLGDQPKVLDQLPGTGSGPGNGYNPAGNDHGF